MTRCKRKGKKGQVSMFIAFFFMALIIIIIAALIVPIGLKMNTQMWLGGEKIMNLTQGDIAKIQTPIIKTAVSNVMDSAISNEQNNISIIGAIYQYAWAIVLVLGGLVMFLYTRRIVDYGGGMI